MAVRDTHRMWRTVPGVIANAVVALVIVAVTILNAVEGKWIYVALGVVLVVALGVMPATAAHRDGALYFTRSRKSEP